MSNDLIRRSEVINLIRPRLNSSKYGTLEYQRLYSILTSVQDLPTSYDVDKVLEQLEEAKQDIAIIYPTDQGYDYDEADGIEINKAKEIVKAGGINENR